MVMTKHELEQAVESKRRIAGVHALSDAMLVEEIPIAHVEMAPALGIYSTARRIRFSELARELPVWAPLVACADVRVPANVATG